MGKMLCGPQGIFGCSNASAHWGNYFVASTQFSIYVHGSGSEPWSYDHGWAELTSLTVVAEDEEACSREVRVELDQDDVGGGVDRLQSRVPAELADLRGRLVRAIPGW